MNATELHQSTERRFAYCPMCQGKRVIRAEAYEAENPQYPFRDRVVYRRLGCGHLTKQYAPYLTGQDRTGPAEVWEGAS